MSNPLLLIVAIIIATATSLGAVVHIAKAESTMSSQIQTENRAEARNHPYLGMWVTGDGRIRQELLPSGRYDEARGARRSAYQGRYEVRGNQIDYWDDTGFTADGTFVDADTLHHGGMVFYREK